MADTQNTKFKQLTDTVGNQSEVYVHPAITLGIIAEMTTVSQETLQLPEETEIADKIGSEIDVKKVADSNVDFGPNKS